MNFYDLGEALRREMQHRLASGGITQSQLAQLTGFRQAHISNFLNGRRALSLEGLDRLLRSQSLDVRELLPGTLNFHAGSEAATAALLHPVPIVSAKRLMAGRRLHSATEFTCITPPATKPKPAAEKLPWDRFAAMRVTSRYCAGVSSLLPENCVATVDRHDTELATIGRASASLFAVAVAGRLLFRRIERHTKNILLRPQDPASPVAVHPNDSPDLTVIGRVCWVGHTL